MKRLFSILLCLLMLTPLVALLPFDAMAETTVKFTVADKNGNATTTFVYGEPIMVTPLVGEGTDWIGIAPKGKISSGSVRYKRIEKGSKDNRNGSVGLGLNVAFDIRTGAAVESRFAASADIGVGEWTLFWVANNGAARDYDTSSTVDITVTAGPMTVNKTEFAYGEPILVTATAKENPTYKSWYGIVPDSGGSPKFSYGTIIWRNADGTEDDLRDTASDTGTTGTIGGLKDECAAWMGVSQKQLLCLPAGTYWLVYCEDSNTVSGGSAVTHKIQIKIKPAFTTSKKSYAYGEAITVNIGAGLEAGDHVFIAPRKADDVEYTTNSVRWQTLTAENISAGSFNIKESKTTSNYPDLWDIPPGDYSLFVTYAPNNTAPKKDHGTRVDITVSGTGPDAPVGITYVLDDKTTGMAGGKVTVSIDQNEVNDVYNKPTHVILYWGDENGNKLADYTYIRLYKVTGATVEIDMPDVTVIPEEAACLMACAYNGAGVSEGLVKAFLPADRTKTPDKGALLSSFQIVSDIHAQETQTHKYNQRIAQMLADIKITDPNSVGIFVAGDAVNDGWVEEYENLIALWEASGVEAPFFLATGNHEWKIGDEANSYTSDYEREKDRFIAYTNQLLEKGGYGDKVITNGKPYYDLWINGFHYIFLASEAPITHAYLSDAQLTWLREKLAEDRDANRPVFIMLHQQMYNAVDGAMPIQDWDGVIAGDANYQAWKSTGVWKTKGLYEGPFREILAEFPEAMLFSGHSHWDMTDANNIYDPNNPTDVNNNPKDASGHLLYPDPLPNYLFNTAAVAYLVSGVRDEMGASYSNWTSSKGYYVRIYENCIELWGRDFSTAQWVPNAMYRIARSTEIAPHVCRFDDCKDTDCSICGAVRETTGHVQEFSCSTTCKICDHPFESYEPHTGEHACSEICIYCHEKAVILPEGVTHTYRYDCDEICITCQEQIEPKAEHDNRYDCSDICMYCHEDLGLATAEHSRKANCSDKCLFCMEPIERLGDHTRGPLCSQVCIDCDEAVFSDAIDHDRGPACSQRCQYCQTDMGHDKDHENLYPCSLICKYCEKPVAPNPTEDHVHEYDCSVTCMICSETICAKKDHERIAPCSEICTYCNAAILPNPPEQHDRGAECSTVCQRCDATLERYKEHEGEEECSRTCMYCKERVIPDAVAAPHQARYTCSTICMICDEAMEPAAMHEQLATCSSLCKHCRMPSFMASDDHAGQVACSDTCAGCGATIVPAEDHESAHSCSNICRYCNEAVVLPRDEHKGEFVCSTTCAACGAALPPADHVYGTWQPHDAAQHKKLCECGDAIYADHAWNDGAVTTAPTTEAAGERTYTCTDCAATRTEEIEKLPVTPSPETNGSGNTADNNANAAPNDADADKSDGLGAGAIVAIVLGGVLLLGGGFALYWFVLRKKKSIK